MLKIGRFNKLKITTINQQIASLDAGEYSELSLKLDSQHADVQVGDELEVFVYTDGQGQLKASPDKPLAQVDEVAWLKVVSTGKAGAFLDWGLPKDLLVPYSEQKQKMQVGSCYLVRLFLDEDNRIAASAILDDFILDEAVYLKDGDQVELIIADETDLGVKAIVNHKFWGILYRNELFQPVHKGQKLTGFIKKIRPDKKIDLVLTQDKFKQKVDRVADKILSRLQQQGGELAVNDKSEPELIYDTFAVSKKVFKQALGNLYKKRLISLTENGIRLEQQEK